MGIGSTWGTREELLHPRDKRGRFRKTWRMAEKVIDLISELLERFNPRTFGSQDQANGYLFNQANAPGRKRFNDYSTLGDFFDANDALRAGREDETTKRFVATMDRSKAPLPDDLILTTSMTPEAFGLTPEMVHSEEGGIEDLTGKLIADRGYLSTNIGNPARRQPGDITLTVATPKGTQAILPGRGRADPEVILDRDQELRITKVDPDGSGGYYVYAVATPRTPGATPTPIRRPDAGASVQAREAGITTRVEAERQRGRVLSDAEISQQERDRAQRAQQAGGQPGVPPQGEDEATRAARRQQILGRPAAAPSPAPSAGEGAPSPPAEVLPTEAGPVDFRAAVREAGIPSPSSGKRRAQWNAAYLGIAGDKKDPGDALRELESDIAHNERMLEEDKRTGTDSGPLPDDIKAQRQLADLIREKYNLGGEKKEAAPTPEPVKPTQFRVSQLLREAGVDGPGHGENAYSRALDKAQFRLRSGENPREVADRLEEEARDFDASSDAETSRIQIDQDTIRSHTRRGKTGLSALAKILRGQQEDEDGAPKVQRPVPTPTARTAQGLPKVEPGAPLPKPRPRPAKAAKAAAPTIEKSDLDAPIAQLREISRSEGVNLKGITRKADIQAAIRAHRENPNAPQMVAPAKAAKKVAAPKIKTDLDGTLPELRTIAKSEGVNLKGVTRKADIQAAIRAHRDKTKTPQEPGLARVEGPQVSAELVEPERQNAFIRVWNAGVPSRDDSIGRQNDEIFRDVRDGKLTPAEGVRRLENEIELNQEELDGIGTDLTDPNLSREEFGELTARRLQMQTGVANQRKALQVVRDHFRLEPREPDKAPGRKDDPLRAEFVARLADGRLKGAPPGRYSSQVDEAMKMVEDGQATRTQAADWLDNRLAVNRDQLDYQRRRLDNPIFRSEERHRIQQQIDELEAGTAAQSDVVSFLREEPAPETLTMKQIELRLPQENFDAIERSTPESLREGAKANGIDVPEDLTTKQQILDHIVRELARGELPRPAKKAVPKATPELEGWQVYDALKSDDPADWRRAAEAIGVHPRMLESRRSRERYAVYFINEPRPGQAGYRLIVPTSSSLDRPHLSAGEIARGLDLTDEHDLRMLDLVQSGLDGDSFMGSKKNPTPAEIGRRIERWNDGPAGPIGMAAIQGAGVHLDSPIGLSPEQKLEVDRLRARGLEWRKLAERLKATRRPTTPKFTPEETIAKLEAATSTEESHAALAGLSIDDLRAVAAQSGGVLTGRTKADMANEIVRHLTTRRLEHDAYMRRSRQARKADTAAPESVTGTSLPEGPKVRRPPHFNMGQDVAKQYGRTDGDEPLYLPNRGADQGLVHLDSQLGELWTDLVVDKREPNSVVNKIAHIGEEVGTGKISLDEAADQLRALRVTDRGIADRIAETIAGITESTPPPRIDVPANTPPVVRRWLEDLARIPTMRKTDLPGQPRDRSMLDEAIARVQEISAGQGQSREPLIEFSDMLPHESIDGVYQARRLISRTFAGSTIVTGYRTGANGRPEPIEESNPDWPSIRDWARGRRATGPSTVTLQRPTSSPRSRLRIRESLAGIHDHEVLAKAAADEYRRITGKDITVDFGPPETRVSVSTAKDHLEGVLRVAERFPDTRLRKVTYFAHPGDQGWAYSDVHGTLEFNLSITSVDGRGRYLKQLRASVFPWQSGGVGYHPRGADTPIATAAHEMGHMVDFRIGNKQHHDEIVRLLIRRSQDEKLTPFELISREVSGYAAEDDMEELIGEVFADITVNGSGASRLSREIYGIIRRAYEARKK